MISAFALGGLLMAPALPATAAPAIDGYAQANSIVDSASKNPNDNINSHGGGVNVRATNQQCPAGSDETTKLGNSTRVSYEVSFAPVLSSNQGETAGDILITIPAEAQNVEFTLIGTRDTSGTAYENGGGYPYFPVPPAVDVNLPLKIYNSEEEITREIAEISSEARHRNIITYWDGGIPSLSEIAGLQMLGFDAETPLPGAIEFLGTMTATGGDSYNSGTTPIAGTKLYQVKSTISGVVAIEVSFDVKVATEKTYVPVRAESLWKCNGEGGGTGSFEQGCQSLQDFRGISNNNSGPWFDIFDDLAPFEAKDATTVYRSTFLNDLKVTDSGIRGTATVA